MVGLVPGGVSQVPQEMGSRCIMHDAALFSSMTRKPLEQNGRIILFHTFPLTDAVKDKIKTEGQPLF